MDYNYIKRNQAIVATVTMMIPLVLVIFVIAATEINLLGMFVAIAGYVWIGIFYESEEIFSKKILKKELRKLPILSISYGVLSFFALLSDENKQLYSGFFGLTLFILMALSFVSAYNTEE